MLLIDSIVSTVQIKGTEVIPTPLFNVLEGKRTEDYIATVEPSVMGGRKMARVFIGYDQNAIPFHAL